MIIREYLERVIKPREQCEERGVPTPRDRMPSYYYNVIKHAKRIYVSTSEGVISKLKRRIGKALEKNI